MPATLPPTVSIIVPTYKEAENLPILLPRVAAAMASRGIALWELIIVDDNSPDQTRHVLDQLSARYPQLRYLIRTDERGLSSAVIAGMRLAHHDYLVVMDADLSHPPESIPALVDPLLKNDADFVIGSRYISGGGTEDWSRLRWLNSWGATALAKPLVGEIKDPMAGFFALRRLALPEADPLNPVGYKIALELLTKLRIKPHRATEVPITFRNRLHGQSKLTLKEQLRYLEHLSRLYDYRFPKAAPRLKFFGVALAGAAAASLSLLALAFFDLFPPLTLGAALGVMILVTFLCYIRQVRSRRSHLAMPQPHTDFACIAFGEFTAAWAFAVATQASLAVQLAIGIVVLLLVRYSLRIVFCRDLAGIRGSPTYAPRIPIPLTPPAGRNTAATA